MTSTACMLVVLGSLCLRVRGQSQSFNMDFFQQMQTAAVTYQGELPCKDVYDCECVFNLQRGCCCAHGQFSGLRDKTFNRLLSLWRTLDQLSDNVEDVIGGTHVSFTASFNLNTRCFGPFSVNVTIPYNIISLNHGNGYNPGLGIFTAPRSGLYFFSFRTYSNVGAAGERLYYQTQLMRNGEVMASTWEDNREDSEDSGSQTIILSLDKGGQVYVQLMYGRQLCNTQGLNTFSGYLIYARDP